jgi:hypothetical protein
MPVSLMPRWIMTEVEDGVSGFGVSGGMDAAWEPIEGKMDGLDAAGEVCATSPAHQRNVRVC